jgi:lipopolysaccharide export system ATP-binding protein
VPHLLKAQGLAKSYKGRQVVHDTTLEVKSGEIVGLLGPNGAGKTTSFYMIIGLVKADAGQVWLDDNELSQAGMARRAKAGIGYLPQEASIFRKLSVADNIMAILETRRELSKERRQEMLNALLSEFHVEHLRDSLGMRLSGGERRRVEIARAMAMEPLFMLLDEPFAGVDPISVNDIKNIIRNLSAKGVGVLITDHNVRETLDICHKAYIFNAGGVLAQGEPQEILLDQQVRAVYLGEGFSM